MPKTEFDELYPNGPITNGDKKLMEMELAYNKSMPKLMIDDKEVSKGDWIIVEGDGWSEIGCVVDIDDDEINMYDGKEGWTVNREEITQINWQ
jgi:hypothetical protein